MFFRSKFETCLHLLLPLIAFGVRHSVSSLFAGIGKLMLMFLIAGLLLFLAAHSGDICRRLIACFESICLYLFEPSIKVGLAMPPKASLTIPRTPRLPLRFQLPPPSSL
jgi:hypothetical protein